MNLGDVRDCLFNQRLELYVTERHLRFSIERLPDLENRAALVAYLKDLSGPGI